MEISNSSINNSQKNQFCISQMILFSYVMTKIDFRVTKLLIDMIFLCKQIKFYKQKKISNVIDV